MTAPLIVGAMVRTLGAYPSGWRHPGAHADPQQDAAVLRRIARTAEDAGLDYLFFGDWLATGPDLEFRDPYLLARIDPLSAVLYLAGVTERIGLIATVNSTYADPYATARATASLDVLTRGRAGVNLVTGAEPRAAANHGRDAHADNESRYDRAEEFVRALRRLWESWDDDAWIADKESGVLIDARGLRDADVDGAHVRVGGPLNVARPPQAHPPIVHAGTSPRSRALAAAEADIALIGVGADDVAAAARIRTGLRADAAAFGRDPDDLKVVAPVLPVVAETDAAARARSWIACCSTSPSTTASHRTPPGRRSPPTARSPRSSTPPASPRTTRRARPAWTTGFRLAPRTGSATPPAPPSSSCDAAPGGTSAAGIRSHGVISSRPMPFRRTSSSADRPSSPTTSSSGATQERRTSSTCSRRSSQGSSRRSRGSRRPSCGGAVCSAARGRPCASGCRSGPAPRARPRRRLNDARGDAPAPMRAGAFCVPRATAVLRRVTSRVLRFRSVNGRNRAISVTPRPVRSVATTFSPDPSRSTP